MVDCNPSLKEKKVGLTRENGAVPAGQCKQSPPTSGVMDRILSIISDEVGISTSDLTAETEFSEVGIDSLLSLTMTSRFQEELDVDLPSSVFVDNPTIGALQRLILGEEAGESGTTPSAHAQNDSLVEVDSSSSEDSQSDIDSATESASSHTPPLSSIVTTPGVSSKWSMELDSHHSKASNGADELVRLPPHATSNLLSSPSTVSRASRLLFLFPDGSGSAASYASLASCIGKEIAVYGLNCPWRKEAEEMTRQGVDMDLLAGKFLAETKRIVLNKPCIPYSIGGWSAGGMIACEVARQIQDNGDCPPPESIILIDSPNPIGLQNPPQRLYDFFDSIGIFGSSPGKMPAWLRQHFNAFIQILDEYKPRPLLHAPPTLIIYARDGVCKNLEAPKIEIRPEDPREMCWLLNNRTDFSGDGWATLIGRDNLHIEIIDEVNHFSMMYPGSKSVEIGRVATRFLTGNTDAL